MFFHNKGIDNVKLTSILHNKLVRSKVPIYFQEQDPPLVSYKYTNNISRSVFNYNQTLRNINLDDYHNASSSCDCESSTFRYEPHGHVITGDLRIVRNRKLRRLLEKLCSHCGWLLLKCSAIGIGFNGAETNCRIAHILGILLMNSCNTDIFLATTVVCGLSTLNCLVCHLFVLTTFGRHL